MLPNPLVQTVLKRLALGAVTLFVVSLIISLASHFSPAICQPSSPKCHARNGGGLQKEVGLDKPAPERYVEWIGGVIRGDFGSSFSARPGYPAHGRGGHRIPG